MNGAVDFTGPLFAGMGGHHSARAKNDEWLTPPTILDALGGWRSFDLDPCAPITRPWPMAKVHFTRENSGLNRPWFGRVWLNPPYGREIDRWMARMMSHDNGVALIFARTETDSFFRYVWEAASAVLFLRGRLTFYSVRGKIGRANAGAPSALCAYGAADVDALQRCGIPGQFVRLKP